MNNEIYNHRLRNGAGKTRYFNAETYDEAIQKALRILDEEDELCSIAFPDTTDQILVEELDARALNKYPKGTDPDRFYFSIAYIPLQLSISVGTPVQQEFF